MKEQAGTPEGAKVDTAYFQQARRELGPDATLSAIAKRAQELKTAGKPAQDRRARLHRALDCVLDRRAAKDSYPPYPVPREAKPITKIGKWCIYPAERGKLFVVVGPDNKAASQMTSIEEAKNWASAKDSIGSRFGNVDRELWSKASIAQREAWLFQTGTEKSGLTKLIYAQLPSVVRDRLSWIKP